MLPMMISSLSHFDSTYSVSILLASHCCLTHLRLAFVELVASNIATTPELRSNHLTISATAASAAACLSRSPTLFDVSKKSAVGWGVSARRYEPTLKVFAGMESQARYRTTELKVCGQLQLELEPSFVSESRTYLSVRSNSCHERASQP